MKPMGSMTRWLVALSLCALLGSGCGKHQSVATEAHGEEARKASPGDSNRVELPEGAAQRAGIEHAKQNDHRVTSAVSRATRAISSTRCTTC